MLKNTENEGKLGEDYPIDAPERTERRGEPLSFDLRVGFKSGSSSPKIIKRCAESRTDELFRLSISQISCQR